MQPERIEESRTPDAPATVDIDDALPAIGTEEWGVMNRRRSELIRKKNRQGLTADERAEFERLQRLCFSAVEEKLPPPVTDEDDLKRLRESR